MQVAPLPLFLSTLKNWTLGWGAVLLAIVVLTPGSVSLGQGWVVLHSVLEILAVTVSAMVFMVGRNALVLNGSMAGAHVGGLFLLVALLDMAHLLSFPGMPDWLTRNQDAKSIAFWLAGRLVMAVGLVISVSLDWSKQGTPRLQRDMLLAVLASAIVLIPGVAWLVDAYPALLWNDGLTPVKVGLEYLVIAILVLALALEAWRGAAPAPYAHEGMIAALLTMIASEWCFVAYARSNDLFILMGHIYKVVGCFLLYRTLIGGMIREPHRRLIKAEQLAARKGEEMEAMFMSSPDGVILVGARGEILRVNPHFTGLTGYQEDHVRGLPIDALLPERYRGAHRGKVMGYMAAPQSRSMAGGQELYARRRDGSEFPVDIALSPVVLDGQRCVIATLRDASERVHMTRQLRESELRVRSFLDNSADWVWEMDPDGVLTYSSQRVQDLLGYRPDEVLGRSLFSFMIEADAAQLCARVRDSVGRREPLLHLDHATRSSSGALRIVETNAEPFFEQDGRFMGYRGITRDVSHQRALQKALEKSERIFRHAFDDFPTGMAFVDCNGTVLRVNTFLGSLLGYGPGELDQVALSHLFPVEQRLNVTRDILALCEGRLPLYSAELKLLRKDGQRCWARLAAALVDAADGTVGPLLLMVSDISVEKEATSHNARLLAIIERMGDAVAVADRDGRNLYLNPYGRTMLGIGLNEDISGESLEDHHSPAVAGFIRHRALPQAEKHGVWEGETVWRSRSGEEIATWQVIMTHKDANGAFEYWTTVARDIRERKMMEDRLSFQATHDALTGMPNRLLMRDRLQQAIANAKRERKLMAVVFLDLDNFKRINDTLGHAHGDQVLLEVASRLRDVLRHSDTLARQGGDEFIALLPGLSSANDVVGIVEKMVQVLGRVIVVDGREIYVTASLGVSVYPFDHDNGDELLRKADVAMYRAKEQGRNGYQFYTPDMDERFNLDLQMEVDLRHGINNEELFLQYQPKVSLRSGQVTGFEALVRWRHPQRGIVSPGEFIPIAERSMLIAHLGEWVIREACRQIRVWRDAGEAVVPVAVNVSAQQFEYMDVARLIRTALTETALEGELLELEITEGVLMRDPLATTRVLTQIKGLGVNIAVDDFGTGYSSLGYLKQFPVDVLKIDRSFVDEVSTNADDAAIVRAIVSMAHNLDIQVVAEGVETAEQLAFLRECECDFVQGYFFSRPVAPAEAVAFAVRHREARPALADTV